MTTTVTYLFDPLCGWCYGACPAIQALARDPSITLEALPTGLFSGAGRTMNAEFAGYAWSNDVRIGKLTGQRFTETYRDQVLGAHGSAFDSTAASMALTAVALTVPAREMEALKHLQEARYVDGQDVCTLQGVQAVLQALGLGAAADRLGAQDATLLDAHHARIGKAQGLMQEHGLQGVPAVLVTTASGARRLSGDVLYGNLDALRAAIAA